MRQPSPIPDPSDPAGSAEPFDPVDFSSMPSSVFRVPQWVLSSLLVLLTGAAAFQPALRNELTHDDVVQVTQPTVPATPLGWLDAAAAPWWPQDRLKHDWRPVARLTILAQKAYLERTGNPAVLPYYAFNLAAYSAVCLLLFVLAVRLGLDPRAALIGALLFAAHPIHAEAVHQIVGRTELLAAGWMLLGLILWTRWGPFSTHAFWQQPLIYALALGSKEHAAIYPLYLGLAALAAHVGFLPGTRGWRRWPRTLQTGRLAALLILLGLVLEIDLAAKTLVTGGLCAPAWAIPYTENPLAHLPFLQRAPAAFGGLGYAFARWFWPLGLAPDYTAVSLPYETARDWPMAWAGLIVAALLTVHALADAARGGRAWALTAAGLAGWLITSNLPFMIGAPVAPRLWFWPSAAVSLALGCLLWAALSRLPGESRRRVPALVVLALVLTLLAVSWRQARSWRSPRDYAETTLAVFPDHWRARVNLARLDYLQKDFASGLAHAERATAVFPNEAVGWGWVGLNAMFLKGHEDQAEAAFRRALALDPSLPETRVNLANLMLMRGRPVQAEAPPQPGH